MMNLYKKMGWFLLLLLVLMQLQQLLCLHTKSQPSMVTLGLVVDGHLVSRK